MGRVIAVLGFLAAAGIGPLIGGMIGGGAGTASGDRTIDTLDDFFDLGIATLAVLAKALWWR
jgi:hypothetical protein